MEKVVNFQLNNHLQRYDILPITQSGFRTGYSTALSSITDDIVTAKDKGMITILVLIDMSKAFDTVSFGLLLSKLHYYGIKERTQK